MSVPRCSSRSGEVLLLAEVLADSASFVNSVEIAAALEGLGYEVGPLGDEAVAAAIDDRCAAALLGAALPAELPTYLC